MLKEHDYILLSVLMLGKAKEHNNAVKHKDYEKAIVLMAEIVMNLLELRKDGIKVDYETDTDYLITSFTLANMKVKVK